MTFFMLRPGLLPAAPPRLADPMLRAWCLRQNPIRSVRMLKIGAFARNHREPSYRLHLAHRGGGRGEVLQRFTLAAELVSSVVCSLETQAGPQLSIPDGAPRALLCWRAGGIISSRQCPIQRSNWSVFEISFESHIQISASMCSQWDIELLAFDGDRVGVKIAVMQGKEHNASEKTA